MAASTRPKREVTSRRPRRSVAKSTAPVITKSAIRVSGVVIGMPRMRLKSVKPLLPPKPVSFRKKSSIAA